MRLLLGSRFDLSKAGGVTTVVRGLIKGCQEHGDAVLVIKPDFDRQNTESLDDGLTYERLRMRPFSGIGVKGRLGTVAHMPRTLSSIAGLLTTHRPDVVNLHFFADVWGYFVLLRRAIDFRLVFSVHGDDVRGAEAARNLRLLHRWSPRFDRLVFCSTGLREEVLTPRDPLWAKSLVITNGVDVAVTPLPSDARANRIACTAHLFEQKAVDVLIRAFASLRPHDSDLTLEIAGDGPLRPSLEALARDLGVADRVVFHGILTREVALQLTASARVFCLPSRREAFGVVLLEAMAARTPIVATRTGGIPGIVRDGLDGLLVNADDAPQLTVALRRILEEEGLAERLTDSAYQRYASEFGAETFVSAYRQLYRSLTVNSSFP